MSLGSTLVRLRYEKKLRQKELAAKLGVHPRHVSRWETDKVRPRSKMLERIAEALEVPLSVLLLQDGSATVQEIADPELGELLRQVDRLRSPEQQALKTFLKAMLTQVQLEEALLWKTREAS